MSFASEILYELRKRLPSLRPGTYREQTADEALDMLKFADFPRALCRDLSSTNLQLNGFYLSILRQIQMPVLSNIRILDLGSQNFAYAPALVLWAMSLVERSSELVSIQGLELDIHQIYFDLFKRRDAASYYVNRCHRYFPRNVDVQYSEGDWLTWHPATYPSIVSCFFPYLVPDLHRRVGLPRKAYDPERFYRKIFKTTTNVAIFFHQGNEEASLSRDLIQKIDEGSIVEEFNVHENAFMKRKHPVNVIVWEKGRNFRET